MIENAKRSIAFICPVCRQSVILERSVFQLAAADSRLPCPCGGSAVHIHLTEGRVHLKIPCLFCESEHSVSCSTSAFLREKTLAFSCAQSGLDCCYTGEEGPVFAATARLEETVDQLESAAGEEGTFLNDIVMEEILGELRDIAQRGGISCTCGCQAFHMKVNYSSVELTCARCHGTRKIHAATLDDIEDLCCQKTLTIHGNLPPE